MSSTESETVYDRIAKLEDEVAELRSEVDFLNVHCEMKLRDTRSKWQGKVMKYLPLLIRFFSNTLN